MKTINKIMLLSILVIVFASCKKQAFVKVEDYHFTLDNKPYYYLGANFWHGAYLGADLVEGDQDRLIRELDLLKEHKITNLRIMAATEASELELSVKPAFQSSPGIYNEDLFQGLDFLLAEMAKRDMKAIMVLNNYWQWSGGMSQYVNWVTGDSIIDPDKTGDWDGFQKQSAAFYSNEECNKIFKDYIAYIIERKNTITKQLYKDDPTIMSWQLANEPRPHPDAVDSTSLSLAFQNWIHETSEFIHSLDTNHLVSSGNEGVQGSRMSAQIYIDSHTSPYIDYLTFHIWPKNWSWFDVTNPEETFGTAVQNTEDYFAEHIAMAKMMNKPTVLEEFGLERDSGLFSHDAGTVYRDKYLSLLFASVVESAKTGSPMAGLNFWAWGGEGIASHEDYMWRPGDSFMGDPPQEPQGLNSVLSSDSSTLNIFKKYNQEIEILCNSSERSLNSQNENSSQNLAN